VIYDVTHGSLRLTEPVFSGLDRLVELLQKASELTDTESELLPKAAILNLKSWLNELGPSGTTSLSSVVQGAGASPDGWLLVYAPGSTVGVRDSQNVLRDITIATPQMLTIEGAMQLFYNYKISDVGLAAVSAEKIETVSDDWNMILWNPTTNEFRQDTGEDGATF
jgi:hypothetical protein